MCFWGSSPAAGGTTAPSAVTSPAGGSSARGDRDPVHWVGGSEPFEWPCRRRGALALALGLDLHRRKRGPRGASGKGGAHAPLPGPPGSPWGVSADLHPDSRAGLSKYSPRLPPSPVGPAARRKAGSSVAVTCCRGPLFRTHSLAWNGPPLWNAGQLDLCCSNTRHYSLQIWGKSMTFCLWDHRKCLFMFSNRRRSAQDPGVPGRTGCIWSPLPPWLSCSIARTGRPSCWSRTPSSGCSPWVSLDVPVNEGAELWQCPLLLEMVLPSTHQRVETYKPF